MGQQSGYTPELATLICERLASGLSLRKICAEEGMPAVPTWLLWCSERPELADQYARARATGLDAMAEEAMEISDQHSEAVGAVARDRLRVDTRKWYLSKLAPKRYGEKVALEHSSEPGKPVQVEIAANPETLDELSGILSEILGPRS